jgi:hypothetical protein
MARFVSWEQNQAEHAQERRETAVALRTGTKTPWQIQEENSLFPMDTKIVVDFDDLFERFERAHG